MSKIIIILIVAMLIIPQQGLCLRPVATDSSPRTVPITSPHTKLGPATIAFRIMNAVLKAHNPVQGKEGRNTEDFNIMITYKCPFNCGPCQAQDAIRARKNVDMPKKEFFSIIDQLRGFKKVHIVGTGEPLAYGKKGNLCKNGVSQDFLDIVHYAAERIDEVRIVTNGYLIPENEEKAKEFFAQFPKNIVWLVSVDKAHEEQMQKKTGKNLPDLVEMLEALAVEGIIKTAYNLRVEDNFVLAKLAMMIKFFGLTEKQKTDPENIFANRFIEQGGAINYPVNALKMKPGDIHRHAFVPGNLFAFIDPDSFFTLSDHTAYMSEEQRHDPDFLSAVGAYEGFGYECLVPVNIFGKPLALGLAILEQVLFSNYAHPQYVNANFAISPIWQKSGAEDIGGKQAGVVWRYDARENFKLISKAIFFYYSGYPDLAKKCIADLTRRALRHDGEMKEAVNRFFWHLFVHLDGIDFRPFLRDCINEGAFVPSAKSEWFWPDLSTALDVLSSAKEVRRSFEEAEDRTLHWLKPPFFAEGQYGPCPYYEIKEKALSYRVTTKLTKVEELSYVRRNATFPMLWTKNNQKLLAAFNRYPEDFALASAGFIPFPLGLVHHEPSDSWHYAEEDMIGDSLEYLIAHAVSKGNGYLAELKDVVKSLGTFAAKVEKAGWDVSWIEGENLLQRGDGSWAIEGFDLHKNNGHTGAEYTFLGLAITAAQAYSDIGVFKEEDVLFESFYKGYEAEEAGLDNVEFIPKAVYGSAPEPIWEAPPAAMAMSQAA